MQLHKDAVNDEVILRLKEHEYIMILHALKGAASDDRRKGLDYEGFYSAPRGDVVELHNKIDEAERSC